MTAHTPLSDAEIAELRALCSVSLRPGHDLARFQRDVSRLIVDLLAVRVQVERERRRAAIELERMRDLLARVRPLLAPAPRDEEADALLAELEDALRRRVF